MRRNGDLFPNAAGHAVAWPVVAAVVFALAVLIVCPGCSSLDKQYVGADRLTYNAIGIGHASYVDSDDKLTKKQKSRLQRLLRSWEARLIEGEARTGQ